MDEDFSLGNLGMGTWLLIGLGIYLAYEYFIAPSQAAATAPPPTIGLNQFSATQGATQPMTPQETGMPVTFNREQVALATGQNVTSINEGNAPRRASGRGLRGVM